MRKKLILTLLPTLLGCMLFSQETKKILILDANNFKKLPFATVKILHSTKGGYADENGNFIVQLSSNDSLLIQYTGYASSIITLNSLKTTDTVFLTPTIKDLPEVSVYTFDRKEKVGLFKYSKNYMVYFSGSREYATKIDLSSLNKKTYKVEKIFLPLGFNKNVEGKFLFKVHLYALDDKNGLSEDLLEKPIFVTKHNIKADNYYIDISYQHIVLNDTVLYIGVECIYDISTLNSANHFAMKNKTEAIAKSPIYLYSNGKDNFFDQSFNHTFTRLLIDKSYKWLGSGNNTMPKFTAGLEISYSSQQ